MASGDISASGTLSVGSFTLANLNTGNITASGQISSSGTGTNFLSGNLKFDGSRTISTVGGSDHLTINPDAQLNLGTGGVDEINIGRQSGTADINIFANTSTVAARFVTSTITFNHPITASGDISASGRVTTLQVGKDSTDQIDFSTDNTIKFKVANANEVTLDANNFFPTSDNGCALGKVGNEWADLLLNGQNHQPLK